MFEDRRDTDENSISGSSSSSSSSALYPEDMLLSEQEEQWAQELMCYVDQELRLEKKPSLMEIAQIAISSEGDLADAVARVEGIQRFKEAYNIQDTLEEGMACLEKFTRLHEGVLLNVEGGSGGFRSSFAWNYGTYRPSSLMDCEDKWRIHIMGCYYLYYKALQPTLESVRTGVTLLAETSDMKWKNFDLSMDSRMVEELGAYTRLKFSQIFIYNTNSIANLAWNLFKRLLPKRQAYTVHLGCQIDDDENGPKRKLMDFYCQPTVEEARLRVVRDAKSLLELRMAREDVFICDL